MTQKPPQIKSSSTIDLPKAPKLPSEELQAELVKIDRETLMILADALKNFPHLIGSEIARLCYDTLNRSEILQKEVEDPKVNQQIDNDPTPVTQITLEEKLNNLRRQTNPPLEVKPASAHDTNMTTVNGKGLASTGRQTLDSIRAA